MPMPLLDFAAGIPALTLAFFRACGIFLAAPLFGSARVPRRIKLMMALVVAAGLLPAGGLEAFVPATLAALVVVVGGEILFGLALGLTVALVFVAAQWAGDMVGQQIGLTMGQVIDPQFGGASGVLSEVYFLFSTAVFLAVGGHRAIVDGLHASMTALPPGSLGMGQQGLLQLLVGLLTGATVLAVQLAAPTFVTLLVSDVALGALAKTMPQFNVFTAGMSVRSLLGLAVLAVGMAAGGRVLAGAMDDALGEARRAYVGDFELGGAR